MRDLALEPLLDKLSEERAEIMVLPTTRPDEVRDAILDRFGPFSSPRVETGAAEELRELQATSY